MPYELFLPPNDLELLHMLHSVCSVIELSANAQLEPERTLRVHLHFREGEAGTVQGRPSQIVECVAQAEEDGLLVSLATLDAELLERAMAERFGEDVVHITPGALPRVRVGTWPHTAEDDALVAVWKKLLVYPDALVLDGVRLRRL